MPNSGLNKSGDNDAIPQEAGIKRPASRVVLVLVMDMEIPENELFDVLRAPGNNRPR